MDDHEKLLLRELIKRVVRTIIPFLFVIGLVLYILLDTTKTADHGYLLVKSVPPGIPIVIDGGLTTYQTDAVIPDIAVGLRRVSLLEDNWIVTPTYHSGVLKKKNDTLVVEFTAIPRPQAVPVERKPDEPVPAPLPESHPVTPAPTTTARTVTPTPTPASQPPSLETKPNSKRTGTIRVSANIIGASIFLNDTATGKLTPATLTNLFPGKYRISVAKPEYTSVPGSSIVIVDPDFGSALAHFELVPKRFQIETNSITINTDPPGQTVAINGNRYKPTPVHIDLPLGTYRVEFIECAGYESPPPQTIILTKTDAAFVNAVYTKISGGASFAIVQPRGADPLDVGKLRVELDNRPFFNGTNTETPAILWNNFPEGDHHLTIIYDNLTVETDASFTSGHLTPVELRFDRVFAQVKPRLRVLEQEKPDSFRKRYGKILVFN